MKRRSVRRVLRQLLLVPFLVVALTGFGVATCPVAWALTMGKTYDQSNVDEIKDMLPMSIVKYVREGKWTVPTKKLEYEMKFSDKYNALGAQN